MNENAKRWAWVALLFAVGVFSRWIPHPPNFSAIMAIALFAGFMLPASLALVLPVACMFVGDLLLGFHGLMWVVYLSLLPMVWAGSRLPQPGFHARGLASWGMAGLLASILFFATTNLAVWWSSGMYPHTQEGLMTCFVLALPFFHNSVLSTLMYLTGFEAVRRIPAFHLVFNS